MSGRPCFLLPPPNFFPLPRSPLLAAPGRLAVGGWLLRSISCLWLTTASCLELQNLTPIKFFPPRGGRCPGGLTSFAGLETQACQQLKKTESQVSGHLASPSPSEDPEPRRDRELLLADCGGVQPRLSPPGQGPHFPFGLLTLWVGTHIPSSFGGHFFFPEIGGFLKEKGSSVIPSLETPGASI